MMCNLADTEEEEDVKRERVRFLPAPGMNFYYVKAPVRVPLLLSFGASRPDGKEAVVATAVSAPSRGPAPPPPPIEASLALVAVSGDALPAADSVFT